MRERGAGVLEVTVAGAYQNPGFPSGRTAAAPRSRLEAAFAITRRLELDPGSGIVAGAMATSADRDDRKKHEQDEADEDHEAEKEAAEKDEDSDEPAAKPKAAAAKGAKASDE